MWAEDASYRYYLHGPLARTELGHYKVQGIDYAYTLQGWLKGINGDALDPVREMGGHGEPNTLFGKVSRDAYAFRLGYFPMDYKTAGPAAQAFATLPYDAPGGPSAPAGHPLFNGNISHTTLALSKINSGATAGYTHGYDQLNRLRETRQHAVTGAWNNNSVMDAYAESVTYDANGNILTYIRNGAGTGGHPLEMDHLDYRYNRGGGGRLVNNRLNHVRDIIDPNNYTVDIDDQPADNYRYDRIGNLTYDGTEHLDAINWTVYGKIRGIVKTGPNASAISYGYDPAGNRTVKAVDAGGVVNRTFYVRDGQGNVMGVYSQKNTEAVRWGEQHLYGSSRLGMWQWGEAVPATAPVVQESGQPVMDGVLLGSRTYEETNHLGNVLATVSDKKVGHDAGNGTIDYYTADVLSASDYTPFGMQMVGRTHQASNYKYGFGGQEKSNELKGEGSSYTAEFWEYDPRLGRRWNVDPKAAEAPGWSTYRAFYNNPIYWTDPTGAIEYENAEAFAKANSGKTWDKDRGKGDWLRGDRELNSTTWQKANAYNLQQKDGNLQYTTITQRTAFYGWFQKQTDTKGFETKWAGAAYIIAQQMSLMDDRLIASMTDDAVIKFANEGNKAIFDDVFDNLKDLYNGGVLKGDAATKWDAATLIHEQRDVVQPIYAKQTAETIKTLQSLAQGTGFKAALGYAFDRRFPIGGPLKFEGNISSWQDRYNHGMNKAVPFYKKYGSLFNWNRPGDGRIDTAMDPDNPGLLKYGEPKF